MVMAKKITSKNVEDTKKIAQKFINKLHGGEVVALYGDLGSGKTTFVQCVAKRLGIKDKVQSPTFVIVKTYNLPQTTCNFTKIIHADLYRIKSENEAREIGLAEYFNKKNTVVFIEWPEVIEGLLPRDTMRIKFQHGQKENERKISIDTQMIIAKLP